MAKLSAKEYLQEIQKFKYCIDNKLRQRERLLESFSFLEGVSYDRDKVQTSPRDSLSENVMRVLDLDREIEEAIHTYNEEMNKRINQINGLHKPEYVAILFKRYVEMKKFEIIALELDHDYWYTCRLHGDALKTFALKYL